MMLRAGAGHSIAPDDGKKAQDVAVERGHGEVAELLQERG